ncbi:MAG: MCE family protein [Gemmatimonadetes bacterium]|nr:MCE family protein [Gemmatimonadota bacterium]
MKWESADLRVGLLLVTATAVGLGSFVWLTPAVSDDSITYYADFSKVDGLATQGEVRLGGFEVGRVADIVPAADSATGRVSFRVKMQLRPRLAGDRPFRIPKGTLAHIESGSLIGSAVITLEPPAKVGGYLQPGAILRGDVATGLNDQLKAVAGELGEEIKRTLKATTRLVDSLQVVAHEARGAAQNVTQLTQQGKEELPVLLANVNRDLNSVDSLVRELRTLSPALKVSLDSVNRLVSDTRKTVNTVNGMMKDREPEVARIAANLDSTAVLLRWFVEQVARRPMRALTGVTIPVVSPRDFQDSPRPADAKQDPKADPKPDARAPAPKGPDPKAPDAPRDDAAPSRAPPATGDAPATPERPAHAR